MWMIDTDLIKSYANGIFKGYVRVVKSTGSVLFALLIVAGLSGAIVTPLWFLATRYTGVYTVIALCGLGVAVAAPIAVRLARDPAKRKAFYRRLARILLFILLAGFLYFLVLLFAGGKFLPAIPLSVVYVTVTGLVLYGKRIGKK
jgi:hypothetical protein